MRIGVMGSGGLGGYFGARLEAELSDNIVREIWQKYVFLVACALHAGGNAARA